MHKQDTQVVVTILAAVDGTHVSKTVKLTVTDAPRPSDAVGRAIAEVGTRVKAMFRGGEPAEVATGESA